MDHFETIRDLIDRVRKRWRLVQGFRAVVRAALAVAVIAGAALLAASWTAGAPAALAAVAIAAGVLSIAAAVWGLQPLRHSPRDRQVARFVEERAPELDDRLVSAVDVASGDRPMSAGFAQPMIADAARRAGEIDVETIVPSERLRRGAFQAAAALLAVLAGLFIGRSRVRQALDATALTLFPDRVTLEVTPGNARVKAGTALDIHARLVGNRAPVIAQLQVADGDNWRAAEMRADGSGMFLLTTDPLSASFAYRVVAGA